MWWHVVVRFCSALGTGVVVLYMFSCLAFANFSGDWGVGEYDFGPDDGTVMLDSLASPPPTQGLYGSRITAARP